jgi:flavin reductase (DIM6/NTAB) family NADH-FMN oxidoreductase RutF
VRAISYDPLAEAPAGTASGGVYYLLSDSQENVKSAESFRRVAVKIVSEAGIQTASNIEASWDPEYQTLTFHALRILRGGIPRDLLKAGAFKVVQRETEFERSMYDGRLSALAFLEDVRAGDVIEYAYSIKGANPVFGGNYAVSFDLGYGVPVARVHCSLIHPSSRTIHLRTHNSSAEPERSVSGGSVRLTWDLGPLEAFEEEDGTPAWLDPLPWVQASEWKDWAEVAAWAHRLYDQSGLAGKGVKAEADRIRGRWRTETEQALAACRFVQDEVRYLGIESGVLSHKPEDPETVLARRSGDCKGKARLLAALLGELGIKAYPALTDTEYGRAIERFLPAPSIFDHVVLAIEAGDGFLWIDPTISHQGGALGGNALPGCERALVAREGETGLRVIPTARGSMETLEVFSLPDSSQGRVELRVSTTFRGSEADQMRYTLATESLGSLEDDYLEFYGKSYEGLEIEAPLSISDDLSANVIVTEEAYAFPAAFLGEGGTKSLLLKASTIKGCLWTARDGTRSQPFAVDYPVELVHRTEVFPLPEGDFREEDLSVEDPAFKLRYLVSYRSQRLSVEWRLSGLKDSVEAIEYPAYAKKVNEAEELLDYEISWTGLSNGWPYENLLLLAGGIFLGLCALLLLVFRASVDLRPLGKRLAVLCSPKAGRAGKAGPSGSGVSARALPLPAWAPHAYLAASAASLVWILLALGGSSILKADAFRNMAAVGGMAEARAWGLTAEYLLRLAALALSLYLALSFAAMEDGAGTTFILAKPLLFLLSLGSWAARSLAAGSPQAGAGLIAPMAIEGLACLGFITPILLHPGLRERFLRPRPKPPAGGYRRVDPRLAYRLFNPGGLVWACSRSASGVYNFAPIAWNCPLDYEGESRLLFVCDVSHATFANIKASGCFALAIPSAGQRALVELSGSASGRDLDKFAAWEVEAIKAFEIDVHIPAGSSAWAECRLSRIIEEGTSAIVIGDVLAARAVDASWKERLHYVEDGVWYRPGPRLHS